MDRAAETVIRLSPERAEIVVEQCRDGIVSHKRLTRETFIECLLESRIRDEMYPTGFLPEHCIAAITGKESTWYYIRHPRLHADIRYFGTEYENFPLPRLVFGVRRTCATGKITAVNLCVVRDERLTEATSTYHYPFSNVYGDGHVCLGRNALPAYPDPTRVGTLAEHILRMPNNNDMFSASHNRLILPYRELLEHLKGREPAYYYSDILIPDGKTLKDFIKA